MRVRELMSDHVICCTPDTNLKDVAKLMAEHDCGDIPSSRTKMGENSSVSLPIAISRVAPGRKAEILSSSPPRTACRSRW